MLQTRLDLEPAHQVQLVGEDAATHGRRDLDRNMVLVAAVGRKPGLGLDPAPHEGRDRVAHRVARNELEERALDLVAWFEVGGLGEGVVLELLHDGGLLFDRDGLEYGNAITIDRLQGTAGKS